MKTSCLLTLRNLLMLSVLTIVSGCASQIELLDDSGSNLVGSNDVVTLVNLHPDLAKAPRFSAVNWLMPALVPMCTPMVIQEANRKRASLLDPATGVVYTYYYHKAAGEPFEVHLKKIFGKQCDKDKVARMSSIDRKGIKQGKVLVGMTKQAVIYAVGYPPMRSTPSLESNTWKYWKSRYNTMLVNFEHGKVTEVID